MSFMVSLDTLHDDPLNARRSAPSDAAIKQMAASMSMIGQLQSITVRRADDSGDGQPCEKWFVTIGKTRVAAARSLGWPQMRAEELQSTIGPNEVIAVSAAENMVRTGMHPVETWLAIGGLIDHGMSLMGAADALGISHHAARRLQVLANMTPEIVKALAQMPELPRYEDLRIIASAPLGLQEDGLTKARRKGGIDWRSLSEFCNRKRIARSHAIFDVDTAGVQFDEDLFAEPGSDDQFTTTDVKGFIAAQRKALEDKAAASKGRILLATDFNKYGEVVPPPGFNVSWEAVPKRFKKDDPRKVMMWVVPGGYEIGRIGERMANPKQTRTGQSGDGAPAASGGDPAKERPPITKAALARLAAMKSEAIRTAISTFVKQASEEPAGLVDVLRVTLLLFAADNLQVQDSAQLYGRKNYSHIVRKLVDENGDAVSDNPADLCQVVVDLIERMVICHHPNATVSSGPAAELIGHLIGAQKYLPRFDIEEVLKGVRSDELLKIARENGIDDKGTVRDVRKRMIGHMPDWQPVEFEVKSEDMPPVDDDDDGDATNPDSNTPTGNLHDDLEGE